MTRQESRIETLKKIRTATCGKEITEALLYHFKTFTIPEMGVSERAPTASEVFSGPLLESGESLFSQ